MSEMAERIQFHKRLSSSGYFQAVHVRTRLTACGAKNKHRIKTLGRLNEV
jgi:hypothetical protein